MLGRGEVVGGRYEIEHLLGEGGLAQVWRVRHTELGSRYALKVLLFRKARLAERLILEGRIQAQLIHPNIVSVNDVVRHEGRVGLLMEFIDGASLETFLANQGRMDIDEALAMFGEVLAGVNTAHESGVLHRDLKPANILLAPGSQRLIPKVTDFGIAKVVEGSHDFGETRVGAVMGTPGYLAPEQALDASQVDQRADIFALGAILYEMLAGARAFDVTDVEATAEQTPIWLSDIAPEVPDHIVEAVHRAILPDPDARFSSCVEFALDLFPDDPLMVQAVQGLTANSSQSLELSMPLTRGDRRKPPAARNRSSTKSKSKRNVPPAAADVQHRVKTSSGSITRARASQPLATLAPPLTLAPHTMTPTDESESQRWMAVAILGLVAMVAMAIAMRTQPVHRPAQPSSQAPAITGLSADGATASTDADEAVVPEDAAQR